jgi:PAS domain S-box-containing protein
VQFVSAIVAARKSILTLLSLGSFNDFMSSSRFREWFWTRRVRATEHNSRLYECLKTVSTEDFYAQLSPLSWRVILFKELENLPFSVSVADASQEGFPLLFINSKFRQMSGFSDEDAIGKSNKFLQGGIVEADMRAIMTETLAAKKVCRVFVTNKRKDGTVFRNLLSMKPVTNLLGEYRYVIGMQFDVTAFESSVLAMNAATDLFDLLPTVTCEE